MVDYTVFALAEDSEYKGVEGDEMKKLGRERCKSPGYNQGWEITLCGCGIRGGTDPYNIQRLLRHTVPNTRAVYFHHSRGLDSSAHDEPVRVRNEKRGGKEMNGTKRI
jgi:hypothetical protein